jgi:hypothetical protein
MACHVLDSSTLLHDGHNAVEPAHMGRQSMVQAAPNDVVSGRIHRPSRVLLDPARPGMACLLEKGTLPRLITAKGCLGRNHDNARVERLA